MKVVTDFLPLQIQIKAAVAALYRHHKILHQDSSLFTLSGSSGPNVAIIHPIDADCTLRNKIGLWTME
jgi:hypothetical protein